MSDAGHDATEMLLKKLEKKISKVYTQAAKEMSEKLEKQLESYAKKLAIKEQQFADGKISKKEFDAWKKYQAFAIENKKHLRDTLVSDLTNSDKIAASLINGHTPEVYAINYNFGTYQVESLTKFDTLFALYSHETVERLLKDDPDLLPQAKIEIPKAERWNKQHINNAITQGMLQGESIPKISQRLTDAVGMSEHAATRNARTATTSAQNSGRIGAYKRAKNMGIDTRKKWLATLDGRTRHEHRLLDGQVVDMDKPFKVDGREIGFPGDPTAHPSLIYNCRCTLVPVIAGFERNDSWKYENFDYDEWKNVHETVEQVQKVNVPKTKTMSDIKESTESALKTAYTNHRKINELNNTSVQDLPNDFISANYGKMSEKSAMAFDEALSELVQKYDTPLYKVRLMDKMEYVGHVNSFAFTYHDYETDVATLVLNPGKCGDYEKFTGRIKELMESGYAAKVDDDLIDRYVMTHEFGHSLLDMGSELNNKRNWVNADYKKFKDARKEVAKIYDDYINEIKKIDDERKSAEMSFMIDFDEKAGEKARKLGEKLKEIQVSKYSLTNSDEFLAECFTASELGKSKNKYVLQIMDVLNKYFKR